MDRIEIQQQFARLSKDSIQLAWALAPLYGPTGASTLDDWGFSSFNEWIAEDICNPTDPKRCFVSRSYAYELAKVGRTFLPYRRKIDEMVSRNEIGVRRLIELHSKVEQGMSLDTLERHILLGEPLQGEDLDRGTKNDSEALIPIKVMVRKGDLQNWRTTLFLHAVAMGHNNIDSACQDMVLSQFQELIQMNLGPFEKYRELIIAGEFFCRRCHKIPLDPSVHHVIPKSIARGYGPQEILCIHPCHDIVQLKWRRYSVLWGYDPDVIIAEVNEMLSVHGRITNNPYKEIEVTEYGREGEDSETSQKLPGAQVSRVDIETPGYSWA